jgi:hypothetical protein
VDTPRAEYVPEAQAPDTAAVVQNDPAGQSRHEPALPAAYLPTLQFEHAELTPRAEYWPAAQVPDTAVAEQYDPAGHEVQLVCIAAENCPTSQAVIVEVLQ